MLRQHRLNGRRGWYGPIRRGDGWNEDHYCCYCSKEVIVVRLVEMVASWEECFVVEETNDLVVVDDVVVARIGPMQ